jgi:hypothetical protein
MGQMFASPEPIRPDLQVSSKGGRKWVQRSEGERRTSSRLRILEGEGVIVLNDRRVPTLQTNIKRIAVSSAGVFVIDAKRFKGRVHTKRSGPISNLGPDELHVGRRDCTPCVRLLVRQVEAVRATLDEMIGGSLVPVQAVLCLTRAEWGFASPFEVQDVCVGWPRAIAGLIRSPGLMDSPTVREVSAIIGQNLPTL